MKKSISFLFSIALLGGIIGGYASYKLLGSQNHAEAIFPSAKESAYERVMRTKTLRCGYVVHPPHVIKTAGDGALSGVIVDVVNEAGRLLDLKVDWAEEVGWGNTVEALRSGRVDAICVDYWMNPIEGRYVGYSMPLYYGAIAAYVRVDDHRFDNNLNAINDPSIVVSSSDGSLTGVVAQQDFPKAKVVALPNMTDQSQYLMDVADKKADITFPNTLDGARYVQNNPGKLRNLVPDHPLRAFPATIALPQGDVALKTMLDSAFVQLLYSNFVNRTLDKYGIPSDGAYRVSMPYETPKNVTAVGSR